MEPLVLRPSWPKQLILMRRRGAFLVLGPITALAVVSVVTGFNPAWGWSVLVGLAVISVYMWLRQRVQTMFVRGDTFGTVNTLGCRRTFARASLARVDRLTLAFSGARPALYLVFVEQSGRALFRTPDVVWSDDDLAALWDRLGVTPTVSFATLTRSQYAAAYLRLRPYSVLDALIALALLVVGGFVSMLIGGLIIDAEHLTTDQAGPIATALLAVGLVLGGWAGVALARRRRRLPNEGVHATAAQHEAMRAAAMRSRDGLIIAMIIPIVGGVALTGAAGMATHARYTSARLCSSGTPQPACRLVLQAEVTSIHNQGRGTYQITFSGATPIPHAYTDTSAVDFLELHTGEQVAVELWNGSVTSIATDQGIRETFATQSGAWIGVVIGAGLTLVFGCAFAVPVVRLIRLRRLMAERPRW